MNICKTCGRAYDSIKEGHDCRGPVDQLRPVTWTELNGKFIGITHFKQKILKQIDKITRRLDALEKDLGVKE